MSWASATPLDKIERSAVASIAQRQRYAPGEVVFHQGDESDSIHLVVCGHLAVTVSLPGRERAILSVLGAGGLFGELSMLAGQAAASRSVTVQALDEAETLVMTEPAFHELCDQNPTFERHIAVLTAERLRGLNDHLVRMMYLGLDQRLYACLVELSDAFDDHAGNTVIPLTQRHLADMAGGTRPSVNQVLQRLVADKVIELGRGRVVILDAAALARRVAPPGFDKREGGPS
jgi:CRP/FNR family cyclic AMP-dependent transcriptional regulator